jgi:thioredoxin reductase
LEAPGADAARDAGLLVNGLTNAPQDWERIIIIGGGDVGYDYALSLTAAGKQCVLVMRHKPRAIPRLVQQAKEAAIREIQLDLPLEIQCKKGQVVLPTADEEIKADGVIVAIGRAPDDNLIKSLSAVVADEQTGQSNFTGLYLCGSVRRSARERHIHIAAADGLKTAIAITEERNDGATR